MGFIVRIAIPIIDYIYKILCMVFHWLLAVVYWSRGRTVPPIKNPILKMSATELAEQIRARTLTSECVVRAFIDRIMDVDPFINATVERRFTDALKEAREADAFISSGTLTKKQIAEQKPLLGVPFTVKVLLTVKGMKSTASSLLFQDVRAQEDAPTVALMKEAGAIVIATTNAPEMGCNFETTNVVHGTTSNPYNTSRTSGGSSGGESAILSAAGSVIGLGNDLAGSVRVPGLFTGIFGHKPSRGLVSNGGSFPTPFGKAVRFLYTGPMCRYAKDLETLMKILSVKGEKAAKFGEAVDFSSMKIYYMKSIGKIPFVCEVDDEIQAAVSKAASYFGKKYGTKTIETNIPLFKQSSNIYIHSVLSSVSDVSEILTAGKETVDGYTELVKWVVRQSNFTIGPIIVMNAKNVPFIYNSKSDGFFKRLEDELYKQLSNLLDERSVLIMPTLPFPAPYHNEMTLLLPSICYTSIFNPLGLPATHCPTGLNKEGLPIGVQIIGRMGNDALTIACAKELEKAFGGWLPPA